jgi:uracil-DNA glycosylase
MDPDHFVERLASARIGATFNFYRYGRGAVLRRERLVSYLDARRHASLLLVGEAAGWRGARQSGVPFTSERQLTGTGPAEPTATIVRRVLAELELEDDVLCWNVVPTHPHRPARSNTNRMPTRAEVEAGLPFLAELARGRRVIAVGRLAERATGAPYVRHPAHGGAVPFRSGMVATLRRRAGAFCPPFA